MRRITCRRSRCIGGHSSRRTRQRRPERRTRRVACAPRQRRSSLPDLRNARRRIAPEPSTRPKHRSLPIRARLQHPPLLPCIRGSPAPCSVVEDASAGAAHARVPALRSTPARHRRRRESLNHTGHTATPGTAAQRPFLASIGHASVWLPSLISDPRHCDARAIPGSVRLSGMNAMPNTPGSSVPVGRSPTRCQVCPASNDLYKAWRLVAAVSWK